MIWGRQVVLEMRPSNVALALAAFVAVPVGAIGGGPFRIAVLFFLILIGLGVWQALPWLQQAAEASTLRPSPRPRTYAGGSAVQR